MSNKKLFSVFLLLGLTFLLGYSSPGEAAASQDKNQLLFLNRVIRYEIACVDLAEEALQKGKRSEIKELAKDIIKVQEGKIDELRKLRKDWFGEKITVADPEEMMDEHECCKSAPSFKDFDQEFLYKMIMHQQKCLDLVEKDGIKSDKPEIRKIAQEIIENQAEKIKLIQGWEKEWYQK